MVEPDSLVLEHLRAIRGEVGKIASEMYAMRIEMSSMRQHLSAVMTLQELDHTEIADIKVRLDRIEKRLDLVH